MRNEALDFAFGFVPMAVTGLVLSVVGGRVTDVYCGTLTPVSPFACRGFCPGAPCMQSAWVPYWNGLYFLAAGVVLGLILLMAGSPMPRTATKVTVGPAEGQPPPERNPSTTTHLLAVDTMLPRPNKG